MMSHPEENANPPSYETIMSNDESTFPMSNVPLTNIHENDSPPPPDYYTSTPNQTWSPHSVTPPWSLDNITSQQPDSPPPFYKTFLRSKPKALGILIIVVATLEIALGIALGIIASTNTVLSGIPYWGPIFYIVAGSLTLAAHSKLSICLIKGSLFMTSISCIISIIAVILNVIDLATIRCYKVDLSNDFNDYINYIDGDDPNDYNEGHGNNNNNHQGNHNNHHHDRSSFQMQCPEYIGGSYAVLSFLLTINLLLFFVTFTISFFGCRSLSEAKSTAPQVYVIPNDGVTKKPDAFPEFDFIPVQPPPYTAN